MAHAKINLSRMYDWIERNLELDVSQPDDGAIMQSFGFDSPEQARTLLAELADAGRITIKGYGETRTIALGRFKSALVPAARPMPAAKRSDPVVDAGLAKIAAIVARGGNASAARATQAATALKAIGAKRPPVAAPTKPKPIVMPVPAPPKKEAPAMPAKSVQLTGGNTVRQGVQYDEDRNIGAYWLFDEHPGDVLMGGSSMSAPVDAEHVDHVFERLRFGQSRGVSWLSSVAMTLRDIGDIEDAVRMQQKVQACLGLVITPPEGSAGSPLAAAREGDERPERGVEALSPGLIFRARPGETVNTINPTQSGGAVEFIRQQMAAVSANMAPYHLMTGDVSQANYSSLRAAMLGHWALLDDWQQNVIIPHQVGPAVQRRLRTLWLQTGDRRVMDCKIAYALPIRRFVDPIKDLMGELIEIRAGLKLLSRSLAERGINADDHMRAIKQMNDLIDELGLALDSDPRRLTDSGVLQAAAGYIAPKGADNAAK